MELYTKNYPAGYEALPSENTPVTPTVMDNIEDGIYQASVNNITNEANINKLNTGWVAFPTTLAYLSVDSPTGVLTTGIDIRAFLEQGDKIKYDQSHSLTGYWSFNTNSTPEVGGFTMANVGTPTYTAGKFSNALTLNGTDQALAITDTALLKPTGAFSLGCWFKTTAVNTEQALFQSFSINPTNRAGFYFEITAGNILSLGVGSNASSANTSTINGTTNVVDNAWHYVVVTYNNNYYQIYLDGKLEANNFGVAPVYGATNYVRIGCINTAGSNTVFMKGQIDDLFLMNGYALSEEHIRAKYILATAQGASAFTITKTAFVSTDPTATTITCYHGTDSMLIDAVISNIYYSKVKKPYGFNINPDKWTIKFVNLTDINTGNVASKNTITNFTGMQLSVPAGLWKLSGKGHILNGVTATYSKFYVGLSTANNSFSDSELKFTSPSISASVTQNGARATVEKDIQLNAKTTYYLNTKSDTDNATLYLMGATLEATIIKAKSNYL